MVNDDRLEAARRVLHGPDTHAIRDTSDLAGDAEALSRRVANLTDALPGGDEVLDRLRVRSLWGLSQALRRRGCHHEAERWLDAALMVAREAAGVDDSDIAAIEDEIRSLSKYMGRERNTFPSLEARPWRPPRRLASDP